MNADALVTVVLLVIFIVWFYGPWQESCADYARQVVFEQRDRLFDMAAGGKLSFKSHDYKNTRNKLNAAIRFAHRMTLGRILFFVLCEKFGLISVPDVDSATRQNQHATEINAEISDIMTKSFKAIVVSMAARSLIFILLFIVMSPIILLSAYLYYLVAGITEATRVCAEAILEPMVRALKIEASFEA